MSGAAGMAVVIGIVAVLLVGGFLVAWMRDKNRSHEVSEDPERPGPGSGPHEQTPGH